MKPWQELEEPPHDVEMVSYASIEESNATEQQEQSTIPMDPLSKRFIPIDQRKWNDIPAVHSVKKVSLAWRVSKKVTIFSRHQELHREIDGAIHVGVLCYICYDAKSKSKVLESSQILNG